MTVIILLGSFIVPIGMAYARRRWMQAEYWFNVAALVAMLIFGNIAALSVAQIIRDHTVFMTSVHAVF